MNLFALELVEDAVERRSFGKFGDERVSRVTAKLGDAFLRLRRKFRV